MTAAEGMAKVLADRPCLAMPPGYQTLPPRCHRQHGHEGDHTTWESGAKRFDVWANDGSEINTTPPVYEFEESA